MNIRYRSIFNGLASESEQHAQQEFQSLYEQTSARLYISAKNFLKSKELATQAMENVFSEIWLNRKEMGNVDQPESILDRMLKKHTLAVIRKDVDEKIKRFKNIAKWQWLDDSAGEINVYHLPRLIDQLPPTRNEILRLAMLEGVDSNLIAERLDLSLNAVHHHLRQGIKELKKSSRNIKCETGTSDQFGAAEPKS